MSDLYDFIPDDEEIGNIEKEFRDHSFTIYMWPEAWRQAKDEIGKKLDWQRVEFGQADADRIIPAKSGIYAFSICIKRTSMPSHGVLVYFGQTSKLLDRYQQYLQKRDKGNARRPKIERLFRRWKEDLDFHFAPIQTSEDERRSIETSLNDAVIPYCVVKDFSAKIRGMVQAMRS